MTWRNVRIQGWVFPLFSPNSVDRLSQNFHRFTILYRSCDTRSVGLILWDNTVYRKGPMALKQCQMFLVYSENGGKTLKCTCLNSRSKIEIRLLIIFLSDLFTITLCMCTCTCELTVNLRVQWMQGQSYTVRISSEAGVWCNLELQSLT